MEISDHQLIYYTGNFPVASRAYEQIEFFSLNNHTAEAYKEALSEVYFPNYENFGDVIKFTKTLLTN